MSDDALLKIEDLRTYFQMEGGLARAVDGVSYEIRPGRTLAVVGESGSGKSVTALSILRLIPSPPGVHAGGQILFMGRDLTKLSEAELRDIRGNQIAMIFQEPMTSLNPVFTVGDQIGESLRLHKGMSRAQAREHAIQMLREVKIPSPEARVDEYPHQLSGGMRQRVMIAMALACNPKLLIADEPTTALDVTVQAQILDLMRELQTRNGTAILFITHDLGVVAEMADDVVVMYAGKVVERADVQTLFDAPTHPYTQGLFRSMPALDGQRGPLIPIEGSVPSPLEFPSGCRFRNRCPQATQRCEEAEPALLEHGPGHVVACHVVEAKRQGVSV
ncbi:ABC transporter ATP-binding protein [Myxococcota bacterium]|nr:ABC transporter ATP-binding protein [Myxococcota bacterium]